MAEVQLILDKVPVILPISLVAVAWQLLVLLYILFDFALTVLVTCFPSDYFLRELLYHYFDSILIVILVLDILYSLNTCIIRKGVVIESRKAISFDYMFSLYFYVDIISLIVAIVQLSVNSLENYQTYYNFVVFIKIIKVYEFDKNIKRYGLKSFNSLLFYQITKNIIFLALMCHVFGCFAYLIDYNLLNQQYYGDPDVEPVYWLLDSFAYEGILYQSFWVRYNYCFYYSTSILSGIAYGDLTPLNPLETVYNMFILLLPLVIYSYIFNAIYEVISKNREKNRRVKRYQFLAKRYLKTLRVKKVLQIKLITYLSYVFKRTISNTQFIESLAPSARKKYIAHTINSKFDFSIFDQMLSITPITDKYSFRTSLISLIHEQSFPEKYKMITPPSKIKLYYINQGICKRVTMTSVKYSDDINRKQYACFYPFLTGLITSKLRYQSASFVICQAINRSQFLQLLKDRHFYELKQAYFLMKEEKMMYQNETIIGENCFFCQSQAHFMSNCAYLRPKISIDTQRPVVINKRNNFKRGTMKPRRIIRKWNRNEQKIESNKETGVQCQGFNKKGGMGMNEFEMLAHMRIYYSQFNIDQ